MTPPAQDSAPARPASKVTRSDVAKLAGVSPAVVSYVTNHGPRPVAPATRERVEAAIEKLGYRPDALATAFRDGRVNSVGLLVPSPVNPYYAELAQSVETELLGRGCSMSVGISSFRTALDSWHLRSFNDRRLRGVIVASEASLVPWFAMSATTPTVVLDNVTTPYPFVSSVYADVTRDVRRAVEHLQSHGHRRIALLAGPPAWRETVLHMAAWREQQHADGNPCDDTLVAFGDVSEAGGWSALRSLFVTDAAKRTPLAAPPTAVVVGSDIQALGAMRACYELGLRIPEDLAVVSMDGIEQCRFACPTLTTVRQPMKEIVRLAVSQILDGEGIPPIVRSLGGNIVLAESCGCSPAPHTWT